MNLSLTEIVASCETALAAASTTAAEAHADVDRLTLERVAAHDRYFKSPDDERAKAAAIASDAEVRLAEERARRGDEDRASAARALADARSTLDGAQREAEKAKLRTAASPSALHEATRTHWKNFAATSSVLKLDAIAAALASARAAERELDRLGERLPSILGWHAFLDPLEQAAAAGLGYRMGVLRELCPESAIGWLVSRNALIEMPPEHVDHFRRTLRILRAGARSMYDVEAALGREDDAKRAAAPPPPPMPAARSGRSSHGSPPSQNGRIVSSRGEDLGWVQPVAAARGFNREPR
jgi:hypothetical protein